MKEGSGGGVEIGRQVRGGSGVGDTGEHDLLILQKRSVLLLEDFDLGAQYGILSLEFGLFAIDQFHGGLEFGQEEFGTLARLEGVHAVGFATGLEFGFLRLVVVVFGPVGCRTLVVVVVNSVVAGMAVTAGGIATVGQ